MQTDDLLDLINKTVSPITQETENKGGADETCTNVYKDSDCVQNSELTARNDDGDSNVRQGHFQGDARIYKDNIVYCCEVVDKEGPSNDSQTSHDSQTNCGQPINVNTCTQTEQSNSCDTGYIIKQEMPDPNIDKGIKRELPNWNSNIGIKHEPSDPNDTQTSDCDKCSLCGNSINQRNLTDELSKTKTELESTRQSLAKAERQLEKADNYNSVLRNMVEQLSGEIHRYKNAKTQSTMVQVDQDDFLNYITGDYTMPLWNAGEQPTLQANEGQGHIATANPMEQSQTDGQAMIEPLSIADSVKAAAEAVVQQQTNEALLHSGYVYDKQSGLYYHAETGYYYDTEKGLYYDPTSYTYFYYNYDTGEYQFHSKVDPSEYYNTQNQASQSNQSRQNQQASAAKKKKEKKKKKAQLEEEKIYKNRKERRKAMLEMKLRNKEKKKEKKSKKRKKHSDSKKKKKKRNHSDDESEWDSELERVIHRYDRQHKKKREHRKKDKSDKHKKTRKDDSIGVEEQSEVDNKEDNEYFDSRTGMNSELNIVDKELSDKVSCYRNNDEDMERELGKETDEKDKDNARIVYKTGSKIIETDLEDITDQEDDLIITDKNEEPENVKCISIKNKPCDTEMRTKDGFGQLSDAVSISSDSLHDDRVMVSNEDVEMESGELTDSTTTSNSSEDSSDTYSEISSSEDDLEDVQQEQHQEIAGQLPPCIRVIVTESDCVNIGMLYLITCSGATIGREGDRKHDIPLPDINISKWHAEIKFNTDKRQYEIVDKGSQNGTFVNEERLSMAKEPSSPHPLIHGDTVQMGETKLLCHIHTGTDTCDDCEPGVVMARHKATQPLPEVKILSAEEKKKLQRAQMKQIKMKYGLKNADYEVHKSLRNSEYSNRAEERRQTVGSDTPGIEKKKTAPASVHRPISAENVGHKLLQKMGWKEGESLGKSNSGIQEPISVTLRANQAAGLGSGTAGSFSADDANTVDLKKASRRVQALQRYNKIDNSTDKKVASENKTKGLTWCKGDTEFT